MPVTVVTTVAIAPSGTAESIRAIGLDVSQVQMDMPEGWLVGARRSSGDWCERDGSDGAGSALRV